MHRQERQHRLGLTLLFNGIVMCHVVLTLAAAGAILMVWSAWFGAPEEWSLGRLLLLYGLVSLPVGGIMALAISRVLLRPVNTLINRMNRLAAGEYSVRLAPGELWGRHPTIQELTLSFNGMARELEQTELLRNDFLNHFSHEFRTPIASIAGFARLLRQQSLEKQQQEEYLSIIEEESLRLSRMAANVLQLSKIEHQTVLTGVTRYNLSEQLRSCLVLLQEKWERKGLSLELELEELDVRGNEALLKEIWINLLDNAIKFSLAGGTLGLRLRREGQSVCVCVRNTGAPIPEEARGRIFQKFYQADPSRSTEGNGVGLAIVQGVARLHGGNVEVSCREGVTEFAVRLPQNENCLPV